MRGSNKDWQVKTCCLASGDDLTVRLVWPQFGLGFTVTILGMNVDYSSIWIQHTNSGVMWLCIMKGHKAHEEINDSLRGFNNYGVRAGVGNSPEWGERNLGD